MRVFSLLAAGLVGQRAVARARILVIVFDFALLWYQYWIALLLSA